MPFSFAKVYSKYHHYPYISFKKSR